MNRGERRDIDRRKAKSRRKRLLDVVGVPQRFRSMFAGGMLDEQPLGKFRNNNIANEYASGGCRQKTNRRKGHSTYRAKLGAYGKAMDWKPHDQRQIDKGNQEREED